ncbi:hypothetical protein CLD22_26485 [Rubrivivax gelatinosus]|uniref:Sbal_3080 family lipoprotein n=1 Tax=Rubrivivax gelatinosus TaxID=28068 RepID=UPI001907D55F|nr:Sbal_3080 family lipoprotein [Rubrivivax gelatinosus]MBZ8143390.1 hypothetical protein [Rubrivivax gelatinosus]
MKKAIFAVLPVLVLTGCAIRQQVQAVPADLRELCVIENPGVRPGFVSELRSSLQARGYRVRMLAPTAKLDECPVTATYAARWTWDLALYMSYAEIRVYRDLRQIGSAVYDSTRGSGNPGKFIDAETKIRELVQQLFPAPAGA